MRSFGVARSGPDRDSLHTANAVVDHEYKCVEREALWLSSFYGVQWGAISFYTPRDLIRPSLRR